MDPLLESSGRSETSEICGDSDGIHPVVRRENVGMTNQEREIDITDCEVSEDVNIKKDDTDSLLDMEQT